MTTIKKSNQASKSRPPRSRSCRLVTLPAPTDMIESKVHGGWKETLIGLQITECRYCQLKKKLAKEGEGVRCLQHSLLLKLPQPAPTKSENLETDCGKEACPIIITDIVSEGQLNQTIQKLGSLSEQLLFSMKKLDKYVNWSQHQSLRANILESFSFFDQDLRLTSSKTCGLDQSCTLQFEFSSMFQQPPRRVSSTDDLQLLLVETTKRANTDNYIEATTVSALISWFQQLRQKSVKQISSLQCKMEEMTRRWDKVSTEQTLKDFEDDFNFMDKLSQLGDISLRNGEAHCLGCRRTHQSSREDLMQFLLVQAMAVEAMTLHPE